jgi:hypothetical protein
MTNSTLQQRVAVKPETALVKKPMSEHEKQVRQQMTDLFNRFDAMKAACAKFGLPIDYDLCGEFAKSGISVEQARREFAGRAAVKNWPAMLKAAQAH